MLTHPCRAAGWPCGAHVERARWSGTEAGHCSQCGRIFIGQSAFDRHQTHDTAGQLICRDPETLVRGDGLAVFQALDKPTWLPTVAWRLHRHGATWTGPGGG
jgi:hypothetical protein